MKINEFRLPGESVFKEIVEENFFLLGRVHNSQGGVNSFVEALRGVNFTVVEGGSLNVAVIGNVKIIQNVVFRENDLFRIGNFSCGPLPQGGERKTEIACCLCFIPHYEGVQLLLFPINDEVSVRAHVRCVFGAPKRGIFGKADANQLHQIGRKFFFLPMQTVNAKNSFSAILRFGVIVVNVAVKKGEFFLSFRVRGKLPQVSELKEFIADKTPEKRSLLIKKYLGKVENYVQAGWLLYFLEYYYGGWRLKKSEYLSSVAQDKAMRQKIYDFIIEEALKNETALQFWDHKLEYCGIY